MAKKNEKAELVPYYLFKDSDKYSGDVTVGVNGKMYRIQRGKTVMIPKAVREVLEHSKIQDNNTSDMIKGLVNDFEEKSK